ncbi:MAG: MerC domain-containing protein [Verrucomicrobiota bacterium]
MKALLASVNNSNKLRDRLDICGVALSLICALHCIAMPLLVAVLPMLGLSFFLNHTAEKVFAISAVILASGSVCWGYRVHRNPRVFLMLVVSAGLFMSGSFFLPHPHEKSDVHHDDHVHVTDHARPQSHPLGLTLLVAGALGMAASHLTNRRLCRSCPGGQDHQHD